MSDSHDQVQGDIGPGYEPDDVPVNTLLVIAAVLTAVVIGMVTFTVGYYDHVVGEELVTKGYSERLEGTVPR
ncbi:MAG: multisubunit Na+/H+ antiporter MnhC subunit [Cognaticolwellia sp.]|jgi:multisubunit Na+/H+ antiporter MnhC subunit